MGFLLWLAWLCMGLHEHLVLLFPMIWYDKSITWNMYSVHGPMKYILSDNNFYFWRKILLGVVSVDIWNCLVFPHYKVTDFLSENLDIYCVRVTLYVQSKSMDLKLWLCYLHSIENSLHLQASTGLLCTFDVPWKKLVKFLELALAAKQVLCVFVLMW